MTFHPLRLFQVTLATSRACAFANEVGVIWFSFLARQDCPVEEAEGQAEMVLTRTLARMRQDHPLIGRVGSSCSFLVVCRGIKNVYWARRHYYMLNVVIRLHVCVSLLPFEKTVILRALSRRLFFVTARVEQRYLAWCRRQRRDADGFVFSPRGFLLPDVASLKLAVCSMSYEASLSSVPYDLPPFRAPTVFIRANRVTFLMSLYAKTANGGSVLTQPVCLRSMLSSMCPPSVWPIVSRGMCYLPGFRERCYGDYELWSFHVHGEYLDPHNSCFPPCESCRHRQPLSLFQCAQMVVIRNLCMTRRSRVTHDRASPFFKGC
nr:protein ORF20 [Pigeon adenovirus 1]